MPALTAPRTVQVGVQFRDIVADSNSLFQVTAQVSADVWEATVVNEPIEIDGVMYDGDYIGTTRVYRTADIAARLAQAAAVAALFSRADDFWANQQPGTVLHYDNGFNNFVRGEVVLDSDGKHKLRPLALVGNWSAFDLPRRRPDGEVNLGYQAEKIAEGRAWQPTDSLIFESPTYHRTGRTIDPTVLPALDLTVPPMTQPQQQTSALHLLRNEVTTLLNGATSTEDLTERLRQAKAALNAVDSL